MGSSRARRRILPFAKRRLSVNKPRRSALGSSFSALKPRGPSRWRRARSALGSRFYPETRLAPRRPGLLRREVGQDDPRLRLTLVPDYAYRPPKPFRRRSESRPAPDEGAAMPRNRPASAHPLPSVEAEYAVYAPAHVRTPAKRAHLFPQFRASKSATRHRDCPHCRGNGDRQAVSGSRAGVSLAGFVVGHGDPRDRDGASPQTIESGRIRMESARLSKSANPFQGKPAPASP